MKVRQYEAPAADLPPADIEHPVLPTPPAATQGRLKGLLAWLTRSQPERVRHRAPPVRSGAPGRTQFDAGATRGITLMFGASSGRKRDSRWR